MSLSLSYLLHVSPWTFYAQCIMRAYGKQGRVTFSRYTRLWDEFDDFFLKGLALASSFLSPHTSGSRQTWRLSSWWEEMMSHSVECDRERRGKLCVSVQTSCFFTVEILRWSSSPLAGNRHGCRDHRPDLHVVKRTRGIAAFV